MQCVRAALSGKLHYVEAVDWILLVGKEQQYTVNPLAGCGGDIEVLAVLETGAEGSQV